MYPFLPCSARPLPWFRRLTCLCNWEDQHPAMARVEAFAKVLLIQTDPTVPTETVLGLISNALGHVFVEFA